MHINYDQKTGMLDVSSTPEEGTSVRFDVQSGKYEISTIPTPPKGGRIRKYITFVKEWNWLILPAIGYLTEKGKSVIPIVPTEIIQFVFPLTVGVSAVIIWRKIKTATEKIERILEKIEALEEEKND